MAEVLPAQTSAVPRVLRRPSLRSHHHRGRRAGAWRGAPFAYPAFDKGLLALGEWLVQNHILGAGIYGFANRLLIPFGLHHILNSVPWFGLGEFETATGQVVNGDIARFLADASLSAG